MSRIETHEIDVFSGLNNVIFDNLDSIECPFIFFKCPQSFSIEKSVATEFRGQNGLLIGASSFLRKYAMFHGFRCFRAKKSCYGQDWTEMMI